MKIENRIVCFIDILGFKEIIDDFEKSNDPSIIHKVKDAFDSAMERLPRNYNETLKIMNVEPEKFQTLLDAMYFKTFSDNITITIKYKESSNSFFGGLYFILLFSNLFQYEMTTKGVYTRGGISFGSFYSDENIIFSTALVKAYELESTVADFPRIVLDPKFTELFLNMSNEQFTDFGFSDLLYMDWDNIVFLSPFLGQGESFAKELEEIFVNPEYSNQIQNLLDELPEEARPIALNPLRNLLGGYKHIVEDIISKSENKKYPEKVRKKYLWLWEFYKWKYNSGTSNILFRPMVDLKK